MKSVYCLLVFSVVILLSRTQLAAQVASRADVRAVVVYPDGAYIIRIDTLKLAAGSQFVTIDGLETSFYVETIQPSLGAEVLLEGYSYEVVQEFEPSFNYKLDSLQAQLNSNSIACSRLAAQQAGLEAALEVLADNRTVVATASADVNELIMERSAKYAEQVEKLEVKRLSLNLALTACRTAESNTDAAIISLKSSAKKTGRITLRVTVPQAGMYPFMLTYVNPDARWKREFDLYFPTADSTYAQRLVSAQIYQSSGTHWNDVTIELSTGSPLTFRTLEELRNHKKGSLTRLIEVKEKRKVEAQQVEILRRAYATEYIIDGIRVTGALPPETEITIYGPFKETPLAPMPEVPDIIAQLKFTTTTYNLPGTYSLASGNLQLMLKLNKRRLPVSYRYRVAPLNSPIAYLEAIFPDSVAHQLDFAGREVRLYCQGRFLGISKIAKHKADLPVVVGLGPDERVTAVTTQAESYPKSRFWGADWQGMDVHLVNATTHEADIILEGSGIKSANFTPWLARVRVAGIKYKNIPSPKFKLAAKSTRIIDVRWKGINWVDRK